MFQRPLIAIDIGSSAVKVMELAGGKQKTLRAMGLEVLPANAVVDGEIKNADAVAGVITDLLRKLKINPRQKRAAISLGGSGVLIKRAFVTPNKDQDFSEQVFYEAQQLFQHDMEDMYFRYQEVQSTQAKGRKAMVFVGAKRELVENHIGVIRSAGLKVGVVDCDVFCVTNMFDYNYPIADTMIVTVNVGAASTQVCMSFNNEFLYTREFFIGGNDYSNKISQGAGVDFENAESLKIAASMGDPSVPANVLQIINEMNEQLVNEVQTTLNFFIQNEDVPKEFKTPGYIFLCGGGARSLGLDAAIAANVQVPVQIASPFQRIDIKKSKYELDFILSQGPIYAIACGLALREQDDGE